MAAFEMPVELRWADLDPNFHLRHSVYYDWAATCRISFLNQYGLTPSFMQQLSFGPILFREEAVFRKEIKFGDNIRINLELVKARKDYSRWSFMHKITRQDGTLCAIVTVDGAWLNTKERKLFIPPPEVHRVFELMKPDKGFEWC